MLREVLDVLVHESSECLLASMQVTFLVVLDARLHHLGVCRWTDDSLRECSGKSLDCSGRSLCDSLLCDGSRLVSCCLRNPLGESLADSLLTCSLQCSLSCCAVDTSGSDELQHKRNGACELHTSLVSGRHIVSCSLHRCVVCVERQDEVLLVCSENLVVVLFAEVVQVSVLLLQSCEDVTDIAICLDGRLNLIQEILLTECEHTLSECAAFHSLCLLRQFNEIEGSGIVVRLRCRHLLSFVHSVVHCYGRRMTHTHHRRHLQELSLLRSGLSVSLCILVDLLLQDIELLRLESRHLGLPSLALNHARVSIVLGLDAVLLQLSLRIGIIVGIELLHARVVIYGLTANGIDRHSG